ncbi:MAG: hypothetical protein K5819_07850 [Lachnospiraceae bacterium]|nr:hypothetical protein [Lachnospiraceae bacterium]
MEEGKLKCKDCPRFKDAGHIDYEGNHFGICGMGGNMVYPEERKVKRASGRGYIHYPSNGCGMYDTVEQALAKMTKSDVRRYKERMQKKVVSALRRFLEMERGEMVKEKQNRQQAGRKG